MNKNNLLLAGLIGLFLVQLLVPISQIISLGNIASSGIEYKFRVEAYDPYDPFRGRYLQFRVADSHLDIPSAMRRLSCKPACYGLLEKDANGFGVIKLISNQKPTSGDYIVHHGKHEYDKFVFPADRYYMNEKLAPQAEQWLRRFRDEFRDADLLSKQFHITARVKNGQMVVTGLYINGEKIEDVVEREISGTK